MLKLLNMFTSVSSHFMPTKLTRLGFFQMMLSGKIETNCLSGHVVKQIRRDLQLLHKIKFDQSNVAPSVWKEWNSQSVEKKTEVCDNGLKKMWVLVHG